MKEALNGRLAADQIIGDRDDQQDEYGFDDNGGKSSKQDEEVLLVLCDGMGGAAAGATASALVTKAFMESHQKAQDAQAIRLKNALEGANQEISYAVNEDNSKRGMGCTLIGAIITPEGLEWVSVGDSLLFLFRNKRLYRLNEDHSLAPMLAKMVAQGEMTEEEALNDPQRHALRSAITGEEIELIDQQGPLALKKSDLLLLASDGLETLTIPQLEKILQKQKDNPLSSQVETILQAVADEKKPAQDNTTLMLFCPQQNLGEAKSSIPLPTLAQEKPAKNRVKINLASFVAPFLYASFGALLALGLYWFFALRGDGQSLFVNPQEAPRSQQNDAPPGAEEINP